MLILSRRPNETLMIGDNVTVTVLGIKGTQVRLGITAPRDVVVDREEVHQRKLAEYTLTPSRSPAERQGADNAAGASTDSAGVPS
jgi:carbon storage regulator